MNILYISTSYVPSMSANSIQVMQMCQAMAQQGHQLLLLALQGKQSVDCFGYYDDQRLFKVQQFSNYGGFKGNDYVLKCLFIALKQHPDLVYTRNLKIAAVFSLLGFKTIYEAHEPPIYGFSAQYYQWLIKGRGFSGCVSISSALLTQHQQKTPDSKKNKLLVAHDAVDVQKFNLPSRSNKHFNVGYVGNLYTGKGIELIISLAQALVTEKNIHFIIVGGNPQQRHFWQQQSPANIEYQPAVAHQKIPHILAAMDVLLMPYQTTVHGGSGNQNISAWMSPLKMFEYMASSKPIIASDLPVLKEVLQHEQNALLVNPNDVTGWSQSILRLKKNPVFADKLTKQAFQDVQQSYTWKKRVDTILEECL